MLSEKFVVLIVKSIPRLSYVLSYVFGDLVETQLLRIELRIWGLGGNYYYYYYYYLLLYV
jgi:hypothetical protein